MSRTSREAGSWLGSAGRWLHLIPPRPAGLPCTISCASVLTVGGRDVRNGGNADVNRDG